MKNYAFTIIGDNGVGKSTFINRFVSGQFTNEQNDEQVINWKNDTVIHITTNQDINANTDGLILMFDIHNPKSFEYLEKYLTLDKPIVLVGTKNDVRYRKYGINKDDYKYDSDKCDSEEDDSDEDYYYQKRWYIQKWWELQANTNMKFYEISSKSYYNCEKPFDALITV